MWKTIIIQCTVSTDGCFHIYQPHIFDMDWGLMQCHLDVSDMLQLETDSIKAAFLLICVLCSKFTSTDTNLETALQWKHILHIWCSNFTKESPRGYLSEWAYLSLSKPQRLKTNKTAMNRGKMKWGVYFTWYNYICMYILTGFITDMVRFTQS